MPVLDAPFTATADFAFQNGARNLVKAVGMSRYEENALEEASDLGSKGLLFVKHPMPDGQEQAHRGGRDPLASAVAWRSPI